MRLFLKFSIITLFIALLAGCTTTRVLSSLYYQSEDNQDIKLIEWEYAGHHQKTTEKESGAIRGISISTNTVGETLKIKWHENFGEKNKSETISLRKNLPFNMSGAEIRLTFNELNLPEVYVFYNGPSPHIFFMFKGYPYVNRQVRQIYPVTKEIPLKDLEK